MGRADVAKYIERLGVVEFGFRKGFDQLELEDRVAQAVQTTFHSAVEAIYI